MDSSNSLNESILLSFRVLNERFDDVLDGLDTNAIVLDEIKGITQ